MWPATAWDDRDWPESKTARGWTVMGRLRQRQEAMRRATAELRRRPAENRDPHRVEMVQVMSTPNRLEQALRRASKGGPTVLAFLFARPDSEVMPSLDLSGGYFNIRTGPTWDLFFPGYFRSQEDPDFERKAGNVPVAGRQFAKDWYFSPHDFDMFCQYIEQESGKRWRRSGTADLVLVNAWLEPRGTPAIDWQSTISGQIGAHGSASLGAVIERMTDDLKSGAEDPHYGIGDIVDPVPPRTHGGVSANDMTIAALLAIAAALGVKVAGIG
jgi:hypothetical protein